MLFFNFGSKSSTQCTITDQSAFRFSKESFPEMVSGSIFVDYLSDKAAWTLVTLHYKISRIILKFCWIFYAYFILFKRTHPLVSFKIFKSIFEIYVARASSRLILCFPFYDFSFYSYKTNGNLMISYQYTYKCYMIISIAHEKVICKREISREKKLKQWMIEYRKVIVCQNLFTYLLLFFFFYIFQILGMLFYFNFLSKNVFTIFQLKVKRSYSKSRTRRNILKFVWHHIGVTFM